MKPILRIVDHSELLGLSTAATATPRRRKNLNLHPVLEDSVQRLFNAMEPGTYVRPHRHARSNGWELMLPVRGAFSVLIFDEGGTVVERANLAAGSGDAAVEIPAYIWHAVVVMAPGTVMFEVKPGPYCALDDKDFAVWAPQEGEASTRAFTLWYEQAAAGETAPALG